MRTLHPLAFLVFLAFASAAAAQWTRLTPATAPSPRIEAQMAFDAGLGATVLFGGADNAGFPPQTFADTWFWDGLGWTQTSPAASPPGRYFGGMAYDAQRGVTVLYGGLVATLFGANYRDDTWEWNGVTWTQVATPNTPGGYLSNPGVGEVSMAYDPIGGRVVLFGGELFQGIVPAPNLTFEYDGANWTQTAPAIAPPRRSQASMCSALTLGGVLLFGGTNFNNPPGPNGEILWNDTWVYSAQNDTWTQLVPQGAVPPARAGASLLFDQNTGLYVMHGGYASTTTSIVPLSDTWVFDGTGWTDVTASYGGPAGPLMRFASAESPAGCHVLFGGSTAVFGTLNADTWVQGRVASAVPFGAGCAGSFGVPSLTAGNAPAFGASFALTLGNLDPTAVAAFLSIGLDDLTSPLGPLPVALQPFGLGAGCSLLVSADATVLIAAAGGAGAYGFAVPVNAAFAGQRFFYQAASIDAGATGGLAVSNGVRCAIGY